MYYITKKNSETGGKFKALKDRVNKLMEANKALAKKYGFARWRVWSFGQDISSVEFDNEPDTKLWRKSSKDPLAWIPNKRTKAGKAIEKELESVPKIYPEHYNSVVGVDERFARMGVAWSGDEYFGFEVFEKWEFEYPKDCKEITKTEYRNLFPAVPL